MSKLTKKWKGVERDVNIGAGNVALPGHLCVPDVARGIVVFVHGSGSSRLSPRNQYVANALNNAGFATLLFDLLTKAEESEDVMTAKLRFDIELLTERVIEVTMWLKQDADVADLRIGYFGASTGAAAAVVAATQLPESVAAIVSRGGRPDLAEVLLPTVTTPILLIVGEKDQTIISLNHHALQNLPAQTEKAMSIVPGATHLFEEPGALEIVASLAGKWFEAHLY